MCLRKTINLATGCDCSVQVILIVEVQTQKCLFYHVSN